MRSGAIASAVSLATVVLIAACAEKSRELPSGLEGIVAAHPSSDVQQFSDWSAPVNLGPIVNSDAIDIEVSISKDGLSLYFSSNRAGGLGSFDIWVSQRASEDDPWGTPQNLGPAVNTSAREQAPFLTLDGHRLYFLSDRSGGLGGTDLYVSRRRNERDDFDWRSPENLGSGVNSSFNENISLFFEDDATGTGTLYFNSNRPGGPGRTDIYASTLQADDTFGPAALVEELSSPFADVPAAIRRDGLELLVASGSGDPASPRPGTFGLFDLWVSTRASTADSWSTPVNLGSVVNTAADEARASLSFDGTTLYMISDRPGGSGDLDLWVSTRSQLKEPDEDE